MSYTKRMKAAHERTGMSQRQFAEFQGISVASYSSHERGRRAPTTTKFDIGRAADLAE